MTVSWSIISVISILNLSRESELYFNTIRKNVLDLLISSFRTSTQQTASDGSFDS